MVSSKFMARENETPVNHRLRGKLFMIL